MVIISASNLTLPIPSLSSQSHTTSILFEPTSLSLALTHSDSSISLYPSFSSSLPLPTPQTLIPPPSSSSTFLLLQKNPNSTNPNSTVLFLVCGPHRAGSQILLRFYVLDKNGNGFSRVKRVICGLRSDFLRFEQELGGVLIDAKHGVSVKVVGSVNYFAVYSVSGSKVWVFAVKMMEDDGGGLKLMRCAVIRCLKPVWSLSISFGLLILGEENGVRVFGLRRLVKGNVVVKRVGNPNLNSKLSSKQLPNGDHHGRHGGGDRGGKCGGGGGGEGVLTATCICDLEGKIEKHGVSGRYSGLLYWFRNVLM